MIVCRETSFCYRRGEPVLAGVDLAIPAGLTLLVGPNGCGKSTLLKLLAGVEIPDAGAIAIDGHDLWTDEVAARRSLAYVPEQPDLTPYATIREVLDLVARLRGEPLARAGEALERVGLRHLAERSVRELSMGQRRRAVLAAALVGAPRHVLLDEPLETLDRSGRHDIWPGWTPWPAPARRWSSSRTTSSRSSSARSASSPCAAAGRWRSIPCRPRAPSAPRCSSASPAACLSIRRLERPPRAVRVRDRRRRRRCPGAVGRRCPGS